MVVSPTSISKACRACVVLQRAASFDELQAVIGKPELSADQLSELLDLCACQHGKLIMIMAAKAGALRPMTVAVEGRSTNACLT